jgi:UDP-glucose:(heptosyl)LPS alpha-1,3-glucosyltransferase
MTIALVILNADAARGGAERYSLQIAEALAARGQEVRLLAGSFSPAARRLACVPLETRASTRLGRYQRFLDSLEEHLRQTRYDVVHAMLPVRACDVYQPHAGLAAETVRRGHLKFANPMRRGLDRLGTALNAKRQFTLAVEKRLMESPRPPTVICVSEMERRTALACYPKAGKKILALLNAIDTRHFEAHRDEGAGQAIRRKFGLDDSDIVALMVATDFVRKGLRPAIAALAKVKDRRLKLLVVGRPAAGAFAALARKLGVEKRVIFAGGADDPYPFYRAADFFLLPTRHEPCGLVILEALAMGLPVITTALAGASELMDSNRHGAIVQGPGDVDALAEAMAKLLDPARRRAAGEACLQLRSKISFEAYIDRLLEIYQQAGRVR